MRERIGQQLVIGGVGGQGVLFVTRLLAEAAVNAGLPVLVSETHGMAQRGGTVISHLKVGNFSSPLVRPFQADGLLALEAENFTRHRHFLKRNGWAVVNGVSQDALTGAPGSPDCVYVVDAVRIAKKAGAPNSANIVLLGFAAARIGAGNGREDGMVFTPEDIETALQKRFSNKKEILDASLRALEAGKRAAAEARDKGIG